MSMLSRLAKLEKAATAITAAAATCQACHGTPAAAICVEHEPRPSEPGFRPTGRRWVHPSSLGQVTLGVR